MNDDDYSNIYDTIQKGNKDEGPDQLAEDDSPLYDRVHEDLGNETNLYATRLENQDYASVSEYVLESEQAISAFSQPEAEGYLLPDEVFSEPQKVRDISTGDSCFPSKDSEHLPWERQGSGRMIKEDVAPLSSFTVQHCKDFSTSQTSPTCPDAAIGLEERKAFSSSPEIFLFVKLLHRWEIYEVSTKISTIVISVRKKMCLDRSGITKLDHSSDVWKVVCSMMKKNILL
ncbi:hypothetical protein STEG23_013987 [Scotinomys teguina]